MNMNGERDKNIRVPDGASEFELEQGVPIPVQRVKGTKFPFEKMEPGDSFVAIGRIGRSAGAFKSRQPEGSTWDYTTARVGTTTEGRAIYRVWRTV